MQATSEPLVPLSKIAALLKQTMGISLHVSTLHRWRITGVGGRRLTCSRVGGRWYTSLERVQDFIAAGSEGEQNVPPPRRRAADAQRQLADRFSL